MPTFTFTAKDATPTGDDGTSAGTLRVAPMRLVKDGFVRTGKEFSVPLVGGAAEVALDVTAPGEAYKIVEQLAGGNGGGYWVVVKDGDTTWADLEVVSQPGTSLPTPIWEANLVGLRSRVDVMEGIAEASGAAVEVLADDVAGKADASTVAALASSVAALPSKSYVDSAVAAVPGATDAAVAPLITQGATKAALDSAYRKLAPEPITAALRLQLAAATQSTAIQVIGDSTGNDGNEWPFTFAASLAAAYPAWTVQVRTWDPTTQSYSGPTTTQTGTAGLLHQLGAGSVLTEARNWPMTYIAGTIDVRARVRADDWTPAVPRMIVGQMSSAAGFRSWALQINTTGAPMIVYSTDGTAVANMTATATLAAQADNTDLWVRAVFTPNDGSGNRVAKFYSSTDGTTWTQIGTTVTTAGAVTLWNGVSSVLDQGFQLGGTAVGSYRPWAGRIYEVQIRDGENGKLIAPGLPDMWLPSATSPPLVGSPTLTIVNGSQSGAGLPILGDTARLPKLCPPYGQSLCFLSVSHNEGASVGGTFRAAYDTFRKNVQAALPTVSTVIVTQNPERVAYANAPYQQARRADLIGYGQATNTPVADTYAVFLANPNWATEWMADDIHPNTLGQNAWAALIRSGFTAPWPIP